MLYRLVVDIYPELATGDQRGVAMTSNEVAERLSAIEALLSEVSRSVEQLRASVALLVEERRSAR